nr:hypothetical protein [Moritella viscosa]SHO03665.1 NAD-dependent malic enzyme [Moritella viscosa]
MSKQTLQYNDKDTGLNIGLSFNQHGQLINGRTVEEGYYLLEKHLFQSGQHKINKMNSITNRKHVANFENEYFLQGKPHANIDTVEVHLDDNVIVMSNEFSDEQASSYIKHTEKMQLKMLKNPDLRDNNEEVYYNKKEITSLLGETKTHKTLVNETIYIKPFQILTNLKVHSLIVAGISHTFGLQVIKNRGKHLELPKHVINPLSKILFSVDIELTENERGNVTLKITNIICGSPKSTSTDYDKLAVDASLANKVDTISPDSLDKIVSMDNRTKLPNRVHNLTDGQLEQQPAIKSF